MTAYVMGRLGVRDYDAWKPMFDSDPAGRKQTGKGHRIFRNVDDPNEVFVGVKFDSAQDAKGFLERLAASSALDDVDVTSPPVVVEEAEQVDY